MHFISIVGNQPMATLNSLLALFNAGNSVKSASLLCTEGSRKHALRLIGPLKRLGLDENSVEMAMVSESLLPDRCGPPAPDICAALRAHGDIVFNLAGGIGFQVAACVRELDLQRTLFVYPAMDEVLTVKFAQGDVERGSLPLPPALKVLELLDIQGISWTEAKDMNLSLLEAVMQAAKVRKFPNDALCNVKIGGIDFACVINRGNRLKFLHVIHRSTGSKANEDDIKSARAVIGLGRSDFAQLFDREIHVLTDGQRIAERLERERGMKIFPILRRSDRLREMEAKTLLWNFLSDHSLAKKPPESVAGIESFKGGGSGSNLLLYVILGTEPLSTLLPVWSHRAGEVNFLYTPDNSQVTPLRDAFVANAQLLPVARFTFIPISFDGAEIATLPAPASPDLTEVNLTPGTKLQKAMLALWAARHGVNCFTVKTRPDRIIPLSAGGREPRTVRTPSAADYLKLAGVAAQKFGVMSKGKLLKSPGNKIAYEFLAAALHHEGVLDSFPRQGIEIGGLTFTPLESGSGRITLDDGAETEIRCGRHGEKGEWFEELVGYAFARADVSGVDTNVKLAWSDKVRASLKNKTGTSSPMAEIDVIAWQGAVYYVISCKATKKKDLMATVREAKAFARPFGRMSVPIVAFLKYYGDPQLVDGVHVIGPRTLADPKILKGFLAEARQQLATTSLVDEG